MSEVTPMMTQYLRIKEQHRDAVLFFRLGDFYEMFNEDAVEVSRLLNLTLTQRAGNPMCGIPYHASRIYIARLLRAGKKIAICEQLSIPGPGKGLAERKVIEVITPGTAVEDEYLDSTVNNYLAALYCRGDAAAQRFGFAYIDVSTGEFAATSFGADDCDERLRKELGRIQPKEMLIQQSILDQVPQLRGLLDSFPQMVRNRYPDWSFNPDTAFRRLCSAFGTESLQAFALDAKSPEVPPAGLLLEYVEGTAGSRLSHISGIRVYGESDFVSIDEATRKNLELVQNLSDGGGSFTLFSVMNQTRTAMGARLLRSWIQHPLTDSAAIVARLDKVDALYRSQRTLAGVREGLSGILDVERLAGRVAMLRAHGKDLVALKESLKRFLDLGVLVASTGKAFPPLDAAYDDCARRVSDLIGRAIADDCPILISDGGVIRAGWSARLDELRSLRDNSNQVLAEYLEQERQATGIANLRIRYNHLTGYYLEVSKGNIPSVPTHFIRRRSLATGDRYTTDRLIELETELNGVSANIGQAEQELFAEVRSQVAAEVRTLIAISREIASLDVIQSFATSATVSAWVRPEFTADGSIAVVEGRHPVVEAHLPSGEFIPNSLALSADPNSSEPSFALITGPNMAGKSTFLRQTALICLMAQIGSFVPAQSVRLSPVDKIFCRVGASDNLARGESTFLVEMTETAHILRSATSSSLVIMDEVGRGTSTEDGLSIAHAVTEFLLDHIGSRTLFATHYHELSRINHPRLANWCLDVMESAGTIVFLKKVRPGASANSYGLHVAQLAGIPEAVLVRARELLADFAVTHPEAASGTAFPLASPDIPAKAAMPIAVSGANANADPSRPQPSPRPQLPQLFSEEELVLEEILSLDVNALTPMEALKRIDSWRRRLYPAT